MLGGVDRCVGANNNNDNNIKININIKEQEPLCQSDRVYLQCIKKNKQWSCDSCYRI